MERWVLATGIACFTIFLLIFGTLSWHVPPPAATPTPTPAPHTTPRPASLPAPAPFQAAPFPASQPMAAATPKPVDFALITGQQTDCGTTCRETMATLRNTGDQTAHNVCVTLTAHNSDDKLIPLNGNESLKVCIGDLGGGQSKSQDIRIEADCGLFFMDCIGKTLTLNTMATSTEKTVHFPAQTIKA